MVDGSPRSCNHGATPINTIPSPHSHHVPRGFRENGLLRVTARTYALHAVGAAILLGVACVRWTLPLSKVVASYILLVIIAAGISVSMWTLAQPVRGHPKAYAMRVAVGTGVYTVMLIVALLFDATWLGLASRTDAVRYLSPLVDVTVFLSFLLYFVLRKVFLARQGSGQP
jgi:hypothetical protein